MNVKRFLKDSSITVGSSYIVLISSIALSLLLPKYMSVTDYGWYKVYNLYTNYIGLLQIGFVDGIYLYYCGTEYDKLPRSEFRFYSRFVLWSQLLFTGLLILVALFVSGPYKVILILLACEIVIHNTCNYFKSIAQITQKFDLLAKRNIIYSVSIILIVLVYAILIRKSVVINIEYQIYIPITLILEFLLTIFYVRYFHDICFGSVETTKSKVKITKEMISIGLPLTVANITSGLVLTLDRQFVSILFSTETYAYFAFAYSLISVVTVSITAVATVLFPMLKKMSVQSIIGRYDQIVSFVLIVAGFCLALLVPIEQFVAFYLPKYKESFSVLEIVLPEILFTSCIELIIHNIYKVTNTEKQYFLNVLVVLGCGIVSIYLSYLLFKSPQAISCASIFTMLIWYTITEEKLRKRYGLNVRNNRIYLMLLLAAYYVTTYIFIGWLRMVIYLMVYIAMTLLVQRKNIRSASVIITHNVKGKR